MRAHQDAAGPPRGPRAVAGIVRADRLGHIASCLLVPLASADRRVRSRDGDRRRKESLGGVTAPVRDRTQRVPGRRPLKSDDLGDPTLLDPEDLPTQAAGTPCRRGGGGRPPQPTAGSAPVSTYLYSPASAKSLLPTMNESRPSTHSGSGGNDTRTSSLRSAARASPSPRRCASDVPAQQHTLLGRRAGRRAPLQPTTRQMSTQRRPRTLQRALHRSNAEIERSGRVGGRPGQHVTHDEHRTLSRRQVLDGRQERQLIAEPWRDDLREMAARSTAFGPCRQGKELLVPRLHP